MVENKQQLNIFLEPLLETYARINSTSHGILNTDIIGNSLADSVSGSRFLNKVDGFVGNGIILYTSKSWTLITGNYDMENQTGLSNYYNSFIIPDNEQVSYKINARIQTIESFDGSSVALNTPFNINTYAIFKVILNGKEVYDYYAIDNVIGFNSGAKMFGNNLVVVYYRNSTPTSSHSCNLYFKQAINTIPSATDYTGIQLSGTVSSTTNRFTLIGIGTNFLTSLKADYMINVDNTIYKVVEVVSNTNITVNKIVLTITGKSIYLTPAYSIPCIDTDYSLTNNSTFYERKIKGSKLGVRKSISSMGTIQLTKWIDLDDSLYSICGYPVMNNRSINYINENSRFRIVLINQITKEMIILVNARLSDKIPFSIASDKNTETLNIEYEKKVFITNYGGIYGDENETFGEGWFGGIKILKDGV